MLVKRNKQGQFEQNKVKLLHKQLIQLYVSGMAYYDHSISRVDFKMGFKAVLTETGDLLESLKPKETKPCDT